LGGLLPCRFLRSGNYGNGDRSFDKFPDPVFVPLFGLSERIARLAIAVHFAAYHQRLIDRLAEMVWQASKIGQHLKASGERMLEDAFASCHPCRPGCFVNSDFLPITVNEVQPN